MPDPKNEPGTVINLILAEIGAACTKHPNWPTDPLHALAVVNEELGELTKEILQFIYEPHKAKPENILPEAIQLGAVVIRFILGLENYFYKMCLQEKHTPASLNQGGTVHPYEALGFIHAFLCSQADKGRDIRTVPVPECTEAFKQYEKIMS